MLRVLDAIGHGMIWVGILVNKDLTQNALTDQYPADLGCQERSDSSDYHTEKLGRYSNRTTQRT